ncbi:hypothetical protein Tco_0763618 [Tanacetum coccineum]
MCRRASAKLSSKWRFRKISMNFKAKRSSFSRIFSLFTLDGYGKVVLALGMTTGSSAWTIGGWTSLVLSLGSTPFPTVLVLVSNYLNVGLVVVFMEENHGGLNLVSPSVADVTTGISLVEMLRLLLANLFLDVIIVELLTISFNSQHRENTPRWKRSYYLQQWLCFGSYELLDLLSMIALSISGPFGKKLPPAAKFKESDHNHLRGFVKCISG